MGGAAISVSAQLDTVRQLLDLVQYKGGGEMFPLTHWATQKPRTLLRLTMFIL